MPANEKNRILLTDQSLQLHYRARSRAFSLAYIERIALEHRKLWLPLLGGGILTCFCLLALMHTFNMPYRLMGGAALGAFGMWWGIRGSMALVVYEQRQHHTDFLISHVSKSLPTFIAFANKLIRHYPQSLGEYCVTLSLEEWGRLQQMGSLTLTTPRRCMPAAMAYRQGLRADEFLLSFDPFQMGQRLQWMLEDHELTATLQGTVNATEFSLPNRQ